MQERTMGRYSGTKTFGYANRGDAIMALCAEGLTLDEVAKRIGISKKNAYVNLRYARRQRGLLGYIKAALCEAAKRRGLTVEELEIQLLARIARDGLVAAILDDAPEAAE